ncbi:restriction endonuclease subunit S [Actinobacillus seminis]|uniref:restriction endonuclease subunit S n=1 Tax=Actinobacillus seminis TaxID=722 RepID=UPI002467C3F9|nr:restriction endonuclease subunit S [Actinobacillus seminis]
MALHRRNYIKIQNVKAAYLEYIFSSKFIQNKSKNTNAWEQRKLGDLGYPFTGLSGKTKNDFGHGKAKFITYLNVFNNPISNVNELEQIEIDIKQNSVQYGDILFTTSSETPNEVGMSSVWLDKTENIYLNSFCFGYRLNVKIDPFFLAFLLRSPSIRKKFILLAQGISRYNISRNKVMEMSICLPCLEEQTAIGNFFKQLDDTIALHQRKYQNIGYVRRKNERLF